MLVPNYLPTSEISSMRSFRASMLAMWRSITLISDASCMSTTIGLWNPQRGFKHCWILLKTRLHREPHRLSNVLFIRHKVSLSVHRIALIDPALVAARFGCLLMLRLVLGTISPTLLSSILNITFLTAHTCFTASHKHTRQKVER